MSSFNGADLFGSGPHKIIMGGEMIAKKRTDYAGSSGLESLTMGGRGWPITIKGQLKAATRQDLMDLQRNIELACHDSSRTLIDVDGQNYINVELDSLQITSELYYTPLGVFYEYIVTGRKLF